MSDYATHLETAKSAHADVKYLQNELESARRRRNTRVAIAYRAGAPLREIGRAIGASPTTVSRWIDEAS